MRTALVATIVSVMFFVGFAHAELTEIEQKLLREEAVKSAQEAGLGEDEMYRVFTLSYLGQQAEKSTQSENAVETKHGELRAAVYNGAADASLKVALSLKEAKQLIVDLQVEQAATGGKFVSPELSRRINGVGALGMATIQSVSRMNVARVNLASYEARVGCNSRQMGYVVHCVESLRQAVDEISSAMDLLKKALEPIVSVSLLSTGKHFMY